MRPAWRTIQVGDDDERVAEPFDGFENRRELEARARRGRSPWLGRSPIGTNTAPNRGAGCAAVFASAVAAGTIASRNGSASVAPIPLIIVRRDNDFLLMNISITSKTVVVQAFRPAVSMPACHA
jgi:hypothetical protein